MTRLAHACVVLALTFAASATAASGSADPRVCNAPGGDFPLTARQCTIRAAYDYFRGYMRGRLQMDEPFTAYVSCKRAGTTIFVYTCKFAAPTVRGLAVVNLGKQPTWRRTVKFRSFVCSVKQPGCP